MNHRRATLLSLAALAAGAVALAQPEKTPAPAPSQPPAAQPPAKPAEPAPPDPSVDQIIKDLQKPADARKPATTPPPRPENAEPAQAITGRLLREGTFLSSRRGRVVRGAGGEWMFAFDADADGQADPPMVLMPCLNLMSMEKVAERHGDGVTFTVSGQVFVYHGRNYLLPLDPKVNRPQTDVRSAQ